MKFRHTIQLGALLLLLVLAYFGMQLLHTEMEEQAVEAKKVFTFAPESIRKLSIDQLDAAPTVGVRQEDGSWTIVEPNPDIRPFERLWNDVATKVAELKDERSLPKEATDLETYGLNIPRLTVTAEVAGTDHVMKFGYLEPTQTYRYAQIDDGGIFLVHKDAFFALDRPLDLLRHGFVVDDDTAPLLRLEYARIMSIEEAERKGEPERAGEESSVLVVERDNAESPWRQTSPIHVAANQEAVNDLAAEIQHARGRSYIDAPESYADYGLEPGVNRLTLVDSAAGYPQTFYFGAITSEGEGGVYVRKDGQSSVFQVDGHIVTLFPRSPNAFRERRLFTRAKKLNRIEATAADFHYDLALTETGEWKMMDPNLDVTSQFFVSQFISAIKMLEGNRFYPGEPAEYGLNSPEITLKLTSADDPEPIEIRLVAAADVEGHYYVVSDTGEVASLPEDQILFLLNGPQAFRNRRLLSFDRTRANRLDFTFNETAYTLEKIHDRWLVTSPEGQHMPNQRDAERLMSAIVDLEFVGVEKIDEGAENPYGFDAPRFTFGATLSPVEADGAPEVVGPLTIGSVVPDMDQQRFARTSARDGVFRVRQTLIEAVQQVVAGIRPQPKRTGSGN